MGAALAYRKENKMESQNKQTIVNIKRYEANAGFIVVIMLLCACVLVSCYIVTLLGYAALESGERLLGYTPSVEVVPAPELIVPDPPTSLEPLIAPTITATGVITP